MVPKYALVYTTFGWDNFIQSQYDRNVSRSRSGSPHIVVDETNGRIRTPSTCVKTSATRKAVEDLGLRVAYDRALFWHNLDYVYYLFFQEHPQYDYYIFLDYDAVIDADIDDLVARVHAEGVEHVGAPVHESIADWVYSRQHEAIYGSQLEKGTILAITVLSKRALKHLFERRVALSRTIPAGSFWPFSEAFIATELKAAGFKSASLEQFGSVERFAWWPPTLDEALAPASTPTFVHPVLDRPRYIASMIKHSPGLQFVAPWSRFWKAIVTYPDRRWLRPAVREFCSRAVGRLRPSRTAPQQSVGMRWT